MARVKGAKSEVILLCVADYFTGAILLNKLVCPAETVVDWRTEIHGITNSTMEAAISQGQALAGWEEARQELWKLIGDNTILVGHSLQHDLDVLRIIHYRVVDSAILARNVVSVRYRRWGLKALCDELLHIEIRKNGGGVHDCLEEVLATREVVLWCTRNKPELGNWANLKKEEESRKAEVGKIARQRKNSKRENRKRSKAKKLSFDAADADAEVNWKSEESEFLFWSDIAVGLGWPHPDTGYDPWSD
jgi:DNA polymerase III epsilon subunit-like protein